MTQPEELKTTHYVYGVEKLNGHDAWALFKACAAGDVPKVKRLLAKDRRLANAQFWYQFPIHMAVREGYPQIVKLLLDHGADPGQSRFTYNSWDKLLYAARERGHRQVETMLERAMTKRFNYSSDFHVVKEAIIARDSRKIGALLRRQPSLAQSSDALGNNALHWSVITRQLGLIEQFVKLGTAIDAQAPTDRLRCCLPSTAPRITGIVPLAPGRILPSETHRSWSGACSPGERSTPSPSRPLWEIRNAWRSF